MWPGEIFGNIFCIFIICIFVIEYYIICRLIPYHWAEQHEKTDSFRKQIRDLESQIDADLGTLYLRKTDNAEYLATSAELIAAYEKAKDAMMQVRMLVNRTSNGLQFQPTRKNIRMVIKNCCEPDLFVESDPIEVVKFKWSLQATHTRKGFLGLHLHLKPPKEFVGKFLIEADFALSILNTFYGKDLVMEKWQKVYEKYQKSSNSTRSIGIGSSQMAKIENLLNATNGFIHPDGSIEVEADFTIKSSTLNHLDGRNEQMVLLKKFLE